MNPTLSIAPPAATNGDVIARNASPAPPVSDAAVLALGNDELWADDTRIRDSVRNVADLGNTIAHRKARFGRINTGVIRLRVPRNEVVSHIGAIALRIHGQEARTCSEGID